MKRECQNFKCRKIFVPANGRQHYCCAVCASYMRNFYKLERQKTNKPYSEVCYEVDCRYFDKNLENNCMALDVVIKDKCKFYQYKE